VTRRKAQAHDAPATVEAATALANRYAALSADIAAIDAERAVRRAEVDKDCAARIAGRADELTVIFAQLKSWWEVAGATLAKSRKSAELGAVSIGIRTSTPKLAMKGKVKALVATLLDADYLGLLSIKRSLDKKAILKVLGDSESPARADLMTLGFSVTQKDEFFIAPLAEHRDETEQVPS
jgi:phage host-nuclease inhibitor protein Gam